MSHAPTPSMTRRRALAGAALGAAGLSAMGGLARAAEPAAAAPIISRGRTKVIILGSLGGQQMTQLAGANLRCGTSVLIDVDGVLTVLDCGCGGVHRIAEAGYDLDAVRRVVITHYHADHVADLASIALTAWSSGRNGADPDRRLDIYGPTGTKAYERGVRQAFGLSITDQEGPLGQRPTFRRFARWHEMRPPRRAARVFRDDRFDVRAIRVQHGSMPSVGYRIRTPDVDIAFSGDRGATGDGFTGFARGATALFHEILDRETVIATLEEQKVARTFIRHIVEDHCAPATVGRVAARAKVDTLVLYHLIPGNPGITDDMWIAKVAPHFDGRIVVARDLLTV